MQDIDLVEGLTPHKIIELAMAGERLVNRSVGTLEWRDVDVVEFDWLRYEYGIVARVEPLDWGRVDWAYFNQYGGLWLRRVGYEGKALLNEEQVRQIVAVGKDKDLVIAESPYYAWFYDDFLPYPADRCVLNKVMRGEQVVAIQLVKQVALVQG